MTIDCTGCTHKDAVITKGHCEEFEHKPQTDSCACHTGEIAAKRAAAAAAQVGKVTEIGNARTGEYIGLNRSETNATPLTPAVPPYRS